MQQNCLAGVCAHGYQKLVLLTSDFEQRAKYVSTCGYQSLHYVQLDQKVSVHLMITIQKVTNNVQSVPRQSPNIY
jgi:hypothetical protein